MSFAAHFQSLFLADLIHFLQDNKTKSKAAPVTKTNDVDSIIAGIMAELKGAGPAPAAAVALATAIAPTQEPRAAKPKKEKAPPAPPAAASSPPKDAPRAAPSKVAPNAADGSSTPKPTVATSQKKAKAKAPTPVPAAAAPLIEEIDDTFVPPVVAKANGATPELTEAQKKELVREQNAVKAAEAEERKRKAEERKVRKAQQVWLLTLHRLWGDGHIV
jgi:hypothetical protein